MGTGTKRPHIRSENQIVRDFVEAALESGLPHSDAVKLGIGIYKEIDVIARDENCNSLSMTCLEDIRTNCLAIMRSGTTFSAFEIATRAVAAWRLTSVELVKLHREWNHESVTQRLQQRKVRIGKSQERRKVASDADANADIEDLYEDFDEMAKLDWEVDGSHGD